MEMNKASVIPIGIHDEVKNSFLDYAMSVIVSRALPDVRDGLKPVHRRILYAMLEMGITPDKAHKKSARIVGEVLGKYHPHGDLSVYEALVRLAQDFATRYPLVDGHGNFGSLDGDPAAAMRYTEARLSPIATEILTDLHKETVDFRPNFDESLQEPTVLPSRFPNLLVNGSSGIAVGMATNIPPHNLGEVINGLIAYINNPEISIDELLRHIPGPDFPTGGLIVGQKGIRDAYRTGRGTIKIRGRATIEQIGHWKTKIMITEIPYQQNKARLIEKIADLVREKKIEGISDLRDESDRNGVRITIDVRRDYNAKIILNQLYKYTSLEQSFGIIMLALVRNQPRILNLKEMLTHYLEHQREIVLRRTRFDLRKAEQRAHIVEGLRIALEHLDAVIKLIRGSATIKEAKDGLVEQFSLTEKQAQAILDLRLQKLTALEREKLEAEYKELLENIEYYKKIISDDSLLLSIIKKELSELRDKYGDERRTDIVASEKELTLTDLIAREEMVITLTNGGYVKRLPLSTYRSQLRGGRGIVGMQLKDGDFVEHLYVCSTHHTLLCYSNRGRLYQLKVYEIPEAGRQARGTAIINLLPVEKDEYINAVIPIDDFDKKRFFVLTITKNGYVKKTGLKELKNIRKSGIIAQRLLGDDELFDARLTAEGDEIVLGTNTGNVIRFKQDDVRSMGRYARGVKGLKLTEGERLVGSDIVRDGADLLIVTENGKGKRVSLADFRLQKRGGRGLKAINLTHKGGFAAALRVLNEGEEVIFVTAKGIVMRLEMKQIPIQSRYAQGVSLIKIEEGDRVVNIATVNE
ncbi:MAG: DNA gyrase subunit A [Dethiobacteria bacterium]|jgi:DNA gyrase subunit A